MTGAIVPPNDLDAEGSVLGAIMLDPEALDRVEPILRPEHFYADANRLVYEAARACSAEGKPCDIVALSGRMRDADVLQKAGGTPYLSELLGTPTVAHVEPYARRIVDKWRLRMVIRQCELIRAEAYGDTGAVSEFVQSAEARIYAVAQDAERSVTLRGVRDIMRECFQETQDARASGKPTGASTGFQSLDRRIGGLKSGRLYVGAGRPGMGKTSFLTHVSKNVALSKSDRRGVFLASIEMPSKQIGDRLIAQESELDTRCVENGLLSPTQWNLYTDTVQTIGKWPLIIEDQGSITAPRMRSSIRRAARMFEREHGTRLGLIGVDYLQLMSDDQASYRAQASETDRIGRITGALVGIAKEFDVPVILLSQLNRDCEKRPDKRPQLADLRSSGSIEQDAHTVIFFYREDMYRHHTDTKDRSAEFIVAKCRGGRTGPVRASYLDYCTKFIDEPDDDPNDQYAKAAADLGDQFDEAMDRSEQWHP